MTIEITIAVTGLLIKVSAIIFNSSLKIKMRMSYSRFRGNDV